MSISGLFRHVSLQLRNPDVAEKKEVEGPGGFTLLTTRKVEAGARGSASEVRERALGTLNDMMHRFMLRFAATKDTRAAPPPSERVNPDDLTRVKRGGPSVEEPPGRVSNRVDRAALMASLGLSTGLE